MTNCYLCPNEVNGENILVRLDEAEDDIKMWNNDYEPIVLCDECYGKILIRIDIEEKNRRQMYEAWKKDNPDKVYQFAQSVIDSLHSSKNNGLVVRDILPEEKKNE